MGQIAFNLINNNAVFRYAYRDSGGSWSSDTLMAGGNKDHLSGFTAPACDELRITATYTAVAAFSFAHLSKLSIVSGLSFELLTGVGSVSTITALPQTTESNPDTRQNQLIRFSQEGADTVQLIITGIDQNKLDIAQVVFGDVGWLPSRNYQNGAKVQFGNQYLRSESHGGSTQSVKSRARSHITQFTLETDAKYKQLVKMIDRNTDNGLVLYEKDTESTSIEDSYLAKIMIGQVTETSENLNSFEVNIMEAVT